jgi:hypothetical protein
MDAQALEIAVPTERGTPFSPAAIVSSQWAQGNSGRGCKSCDWYLDWDASWDDVRPYMMGSGP